MGAKASFLNAAVAQPDGSGGTVYQDYMGMNHSTHWCAAFVCYVAYKAGCSGIVPKLGSCTAMTKEFAKLNAYTEYNLMRVSNYQSLCPSPGDIIFFDWCDSNDADHVAIVTRVNVSTGEVTIKEGNYSNKVNTRIVAIHTKGSSQGNPCNGNFVRGWATPHFEKIDSGEIEANATFVEGEFNDSNVGTGVNPADIPSILTDEDIGWLPDFEQYYDSYKLKYGISEDGTTSSVNFNSADIASLKEMNNLRGILGLPPGFLATTDTRMSLAQVNGEDFNQSMLFNNAFLGTDYINSIATKMPLLYIQPCEPVFLPNISSKSDKEEGLQNVIQAMAGNLAESLTDMMGDYSGKIYSTRAAYAEYFKYVNPMCRTMAMFLNLEGRSSFAAAANEMHPYNYNWGRNYMFSDEMEDFFDENNNYLKEEGEKSQDVFQNFLLHRAMIPFYVNAEPTINEEFSNETTTSTLSSSINGLSDQARELQFVLGMTTSQVGMNFDKLKDTIADSKQALDDFVSSLPVGGNVFSSLVNSLNTVIAGGKLIFPELWSDSDFSRTYNINIKLISPSADSFSIWRHILVPLAHIWALVCPRQADKNGYSAPFLVKAFQKGMFHVDMGIITSVAVTKGKENTWNKDGLPTVVDVSMAIKDLYKTLSITSMDNIKYNMMNNIAEMDFLANSCGINFDVPDTWRYLEMFTTLNVETRVQDLFGNASNVVSNWAWNKFESLSNSLRGIR